MRYPRRAGRRERHARDAQSHRAPTCASRYSWSGDSSASADIFRDGPAWRQANAGHVSLGRSSAAARHCSVGMSRAARTAPTRPSLTTPGGRMLEWRPNYESVAILARHLGTSGRTVHCASACTSAREKPADLPVQAPTNAAVAVIDHKLIGAPESQCTGREIQLPHDRGQGRTQIAGLLLTEVVAHFDREWQHLDK